MSIRHRILRRLTVAAALLLAPPALAQDANNADEVTAIMDEVWAYQLDQSPVLAASLGMADPEGRVADAGLEAADARAEKAAAWLARLDRVDPATLTPSQRADYGILRRSLAEQVEANRYPQRAINFSTYRAWHQGFASMHNNLPFATLTDFASYANRLERYGTLHDQNVAVANTAIAGGHTLPCEVLTGHERTISGLIVDDPKESRFYEPFRGAIPTGVDETAFRAEAERAETAIRDTINPKLAEHLDWYETRYKPACASEPGVSAQPGGADYYAFRVRQMTTTDRTPDEIHRIGLDEVARIRAEMEAVAIRAGYPTREAYIEHLRTDPRYYATSPEQLMQYVARVTKEIDAKVPQVIGTLARLPFGIREIPAETAEGTTTAYYNGGSPDVGISGTYYVNTSKLDQRPLWEVPALSVHEAVPGHHLQISLQQELDLHDFRKHGAFFTAFVEGWGLYSERLGIEMGLYDTPAKDMGRLSYEMWRATRLVVDTGIHSKGWSKQRAIDFMTDNTALSPANIEAEVNRYISWPGQALAYKIGELKIRELRAMATKRLGEAFSLREFHDVVLGQGAVPLDILEAEVMRWVAAKEAEA